MPPLTPRQRAHLRRLAHHLEPVVWIGGGGVSDAVTASVAEAFNNRELVKVKVGASAPTDARTAADRLAAALDDVHPVQTIGRTAVLYRPHPERPEIRLPGGGA